jgi:hypothetical protein
MFSSRTVLAAIGAISFGAMSVVAQTPTDEYRAKFQACRETLFLRDPQTVYNFKYDDGAYFNATYDYDPSKCDSTIPINYIRLEDYVGGDLYTCTRQQFAPSRSTIYTQCTVTQ